MYNLEKNSLNVILHFTQECILILLLALCFVLNAFAQEPENVKSVVQNHRYFSLVVISHNNEKENCYQGKTDAVFQMKMNTVKANRIVAVFFSSKIVRESTQVPSLVVRLSSRVENLARVVDETIFSTQFDKKKDKTQKNNPVSNNNVNSSSADDKQIKIIPILNVPIVSGKGYKPMTGKQRWNLYLAQNFTTPNAYLKSLLPSIEDQFDNKPSNWGRGLSGFGKRYLSIGGISLVQTSIQAPIAAMLGLDTRYIQCSCKGFFRRSRHAFVFNFLTSNKNGKIRLDISGIAGTYGSNFIAASWYPHQNSAFGYAIHKGNKQMVYAGAFNLISEFWPEIKRILHRK